MHTYVPDEQCVPVTCRASSERNRKRITLHQHLPYIYDAVRTCILMYTATLILFDNTQLITLAHLSPKMV